MKGVVVSKHTSVLARQIRLEVKKIKLKTTACGALLACALIASSSPTRAQAGNLDPTFGVAGVFTDGAGEFNNTGTFGTAVALQSDGKIVAGGQIGFSTGVIRLNSNGTLDSTFGTGGTVTSILGGNDGNCQVIGLAIQSDGKIVVGISNLQQGFGPMFIVARLNVNGSLDATFGSGGVVETQIGEFGAAASALALQPDGKILLAGQAAMARYDADGQLDSTFGTGGLATTLVGAPTAIALQPDGKILLTAGGSVVAFVGTPGVSLNQVAGILARYNTNGGLDTGFGVSGQAATLPAAAAIAVQTGNGCTSTCPILVAGSLGSLSINDGNGFGFGVIRYNSNGSVDGAFGQAGATTTGFTPDATPFALAIQSNGDIIAAGTAGQPAVGQFPTHADFALARYTGSGTSDSTFGFAGKVTTAFGTNQATIYALAIQNDDKVVAVGSSLNSAPNPGGVPGGLVVARYLMQ
jgi:uncharacterized delta-60 repeat protein